MLMLLVLLLYSQTLRRRICEEHSYAQLLLPLASSREVAALEEADRQRLACDFICEALSENVADGRLRNWWMRGRTLPRRGWRPRRPRRRSPPQR